MALPAPDMDDCCKKERCLSGSNAGQVYSICDPCQGSGIFDEATCDCVSSGWTGIAVLAYHWGNFATGNTQVGCNINSEMEIVCQSGSAWRSFAAEIWEADVEAGYQIDTVTSFENMNNPACGYAETLTVTSYILRNKETQAISGSVSDYQNVSSSGFQQWGIEQITVHGDTEAEVNQLLQEAVNSLSQSIPMGCPGSTGGTIPNYF